MKREKKQKPYNPFTTRTVKRATVGRVKCYLRAVKPNQKDIFGVKKLAGTRYTQGGHVSLRSDVERYSPETIYYYEVGANDGSYRKCVTRAQAEQAFANLVNFETKQTEIK